ncbi:mandelate racemase/muconate lactonizing enzyme family protein [Ramlibacter sp. AW1]|uniref:Mandelate racemase/muconate lactonizing enzyme family protein n=1 Tax=Ramlibacter aurantiacus TaxID=2801330 RepID=A0A937D6I1_9BURK|nr:mandelate racemase/muconate lactonizing enzyme family protein [Ramlibacter aurantiacus]MBL0419856.1 mandelate racemase/muconate lactonizing enzyme family protein [Ramlibacter aurantiacus]
MKITAVEQLHVSGGWDNWSFLKLSTDTGLVGWSEFNQARGRRGLAQVIEGLSGLVVGEDPRNVSRLAARLFSATQSTTGGLQSLAAGAFENACLDLKAKDLGIPVHELLGGALRRRLPLYWSHAGLYRAVHAHLFGPVIDAAAVRSPADLTGLGAEVRGKGFRALKTNLLRFAPGERTAVLRGSGPFELNIEKPIVDTAVSQLEALRHGAGDGIGLMLDLNFNFKPEGFRRLARALEPFDLTWLEIDSHSPAALASIRQSTRLPIASLEAVLGRRALLPYLEAQAVDVAIVDVVFNGMAESMKMAALLDAFDVNVAAHNSHGPLGSLMSAHFCAAIPNFRIMEFDPDEVPWRRQLLTAPFTVEGGEFELPAAPGWGADIDEAVARAHPAH